jgi:antitoxin HicB
MTSRQDVVPPRSLDDYLALEYPFNVVADSEGGYTVVFPDLPGCMTQCDSLAELPALVEDARRGWLETAFQQGQPEIPLPSYPEEYSGKFNVRLSRSLHRTLAEAAENEGISLNSYVAGLLARGDAQARIEHRLALLEEELAQFHARLHYIEH